MLLPILLTISLIFVILFHFLEKNKNQEDDEPYNERLEVIDFKEVGTTFNEHFSFIGDENEMPSIVPSQGLKLENIQTGVKIMVPSYHHKLSLKIEFTNYQQKPIAIENPEQKAYKVDYEINNQATTHYEFNASNNTIEQVPFINMKNVEYLLFYFQNPVFIINNVEKNGFLYVGEIILSETS